jgi:hypothetical protein
MAIDVWNLSLLVQARRRSALVALQFAALAPLRAQECNMDSMPKMHDTRASHDSAYHTMQVRGARIMGVDQYTSTHHFTDSPDGGRIELERNVDDSSGVAMIRHHLRMIAQAFAAGDFSTPMFVHMRSVPGTATMASKRNAIRYTVTDSPRGGAVRITTHDPEAIAAIHQFLAFQRRDHHAESHTETAPRPGP